MDASEAFPGSLSSNFAALQANPVNARDAQARALFHASLIERLGEFSASANPDIPAHYSLFTAADGQPSMLYHGVPLHDAVAPESQAFAHFKQHGRSAPDQVHILFGLGLGYGLLASVAQSGGHIIVIEPDLALLSWTLINVDLSAYMAKERVWLTDNVDAALTALKPLIQGRDQVDILALPALIPAFPAMWEQLCTGAQQAGQDAEREYHTAQRFHEKWLRHFFQNLPTMAHLEDLHAYTNAYQGRPAVVISRGPSLDQGIDALRDLKAHAVLIAVGSALQRLQAADIVPDYAVFLEANGMREQLYGLSDDYLRQITLILHPFTDPLCFAASSKQTLTYFSRYDHRLTDWLSAHTGESYSLLEGGGTVSIIALRVALLWGCDSIALIGQDLAYPDRQVYAGGTLMQLNAAGELDLEASEQCFSLPTTMTTVVGQSGETLPAAHNFPGYIRQLEAIAMANAAESEPAKLYNASLGGAAIAGFALKPLASFLGEWECFRAAENDPPLTKNASEARRVSPEQIEALAISLKQLAVAMEVAIALCREEHEKIRKTTDMKVFQNSLTALSGWMDQHDLVRFMAAFEMTDFKRLFQAVIKDATAVKAAVGARFADKESPAGFVRREYLEMLLRLQTLLQTLQGDVTGAADQLALSTGSPSVSGAVSSH